MSSYKDKVRRYFPFTTIEARNIVLTILIVAFMFGFNDGKPEWDGVYWLYNMLVSICIVAVSILVFLTGQRIAGLSAGYRVEFSMWWPGLILALVITFISRGYIWIPIVGGLLLHHMAGHRLGFFRYGINMLDNSMIAASGPLANLIFATIVMQTSNIIFGSAFIPPIVEKIYWFNIILALVNLLPIPPLVGSNMLFHSRLSYIFIFGFVAVYALLAFFQWYSWILALVGAIIIWFVFLIKYEKT